MTEAKEQIIPVMEKAESTEYCGRKIPSKGVDSNIINSRKSSSGRWAPQRASHTFLSIIFRPISDSRRTFFSCRIR